MKKLRLKHKQANTKLNESITKYEQMISRDMKKVLVLTSEKEKYKGMYLELKNRIVVDEKDMVMKLSRSKAKTSLLEKQIESLKIEMASFSKKYDQCKQQLMEITSKKESAEASIEEKMYKEEHHHLEIQKIQKENQAEVTIINNKLKSLEKNAQAKEARLKQEISRQKEAYAQHEEKIVKLEDELEAANICLDLRRKERDKEKSDWDTKRIDLKKKVKELEVKLQKENERFVHMMVEMETLRAKSNQVCRPKLNVSQPQFGGNFFQSAKEDNRKAAYENDTFQAVLKEELEIMRDAFQKKLNVKEMEKQDLLKRLNKLLSERNPATGLYEFDSCALAEKDKTLQDQVNGKSILRGRGAADVENATVLNAYKMLE